MSKELAIEQVSCQFKDSFFSFFLYGVLETGFLCVALELILALTLLTSLALNSQRFTCLCLPTAGINGICHQCLTQMQNSCRIYGKQLAYLKDASVGCSSATD